MFRTLTAGEVECRVAQVGKTDKGGWASILIYKDARVDQKLLDEVVGPMNWKNSYEFINGSLYCTVSVWDENKKEWISKQNVGTESNTEKEKGQASDAFKRACFNLGIGRELYTAPKIFINLEKNEWDESNGKVRCKASFYVKEMDVNSDRVISRLVITDKSGKVRFSYSEAREGKPDTPSGVFVSKDGKYRLQEGSDRWRNFAQRVANDEVDAQTGMPLGMKIRDFYGIPEDAMNRFYNLVDSLR